MDIMIVLIIVLGAVILIRGPKMLPKLGEAFGRGIKDARSEFDKHASETDDTGVPPAPKA